MQGATVQYFPNFIDYCESKSLAKILEQELTWRQDKLSMYGKKVDIPRLQAWYGDNSSAYTYSNLTLVALPWTKTLLQLKSRITEFCQTEFNSVLANYYRNQQDSVSWHSDDEKELGETPVIASLSFGAERIFHFKHKYTGETFKMPLQSGSLLIMSGKTQANWQHAVHKSRIQCQIRINLTFRRIK